jgi:hypothetical protein
MSRAEAIHRAVQRIYEAALVPEDWAGAIGAIASIAGAQKAMLHADSSRASSLALTFGFNAEHARGLQREFESRMPEWITAIPVGRAIRQSSVISDADFLRSELYRQAIHPLDGFYGIVAPLVRQRDQHILFSMGRDLGAPNFGDDDLDAVSLIVPHLTTALKVRNRLAAADLRARGACEIVSQLEAVVLLDAAMHPVFVNHHADALARECDGLLLTTRGVSASSVPDSHRLRAAIAVSIGINGRGLWCRRRRDSSACLHAMLSVTQAAASAAHRAHRACEPIDRAGWRGFKPARRVLRHRTGQAGERGRNATRRNIPADQARSGAGLAARERNGPAASRGEIRDKRRYGARLSQADTGEDRYAQTGRTGVAHAARRTSVRAVNGNRIFL